MENTRAMQEHQMESTMQEWGAKLDALKSRGELASAEAKVAFHAQVDEISLLMASGRQNFETLKASSQDAWGEMKKDVEETWAGLNASVDTFWRNVKA